VRFVDWTWPVNGVTYNGVAEVSFTQSFDNAPPIADVVRLAFPGGDWRWFFGRDRGWVDHQIDIYNARAYIDQAGVVPWELDRVVDADPEVIRSLPVQLGGARAEVVADARQIPDYAARMPIAVQYRDAEYPIGYAMATPLRDDRNIADTIDAIDWERVQAQPFTLKAWNLSPANGVPFAKYEEFGSEAVGNAQTLIWGQNGGRTLWTLSFVGDDGLEALAQALVAVTGPRGV
jgi:hypothetical protein